MSLFKIKRGYNSLSKTFRLPVELVEKLEQLATENNISLNQLIIQCLEYAMDNLGKESEKEHQSH
jgi:predicted HicB family RNase H-like nuclease